MQNYVFQEWSQRVSLCPSRYLWGAYDSRTKERLPQTYENSVQVMNYPFFYYSAKLHSSNIYSMVQLVQFLNTNSETDLIQTCVGSPYIKIN